MTKIIIQNLKKSSVVKNDLDPNDWWYNPVQFILIVITEVIKIILTKIIGDHPLNIIQIHQNQHHQTSQEIKFNQIYQQLSKMILTQMIDEQCAWPSFAFMYPPQPPSSSQSSPLISVFKGIQFSSPRFCPFWLRNMYKMSNSTTISSACELW